MFCWGLCGPMQKVTVGKVQGSWCHAISTGTMGQALRREWCSSVLFVTVMMRKYSATGQMMSNFTTVVLRLKDNKVQKQPKSQNDPANQKTLRDSAQAARGVARHALG